MSMDIVMMILRIYVATIAITLATEGIVQLRADMNNLGMAYGQLVVSLLVSLIPIGNIIIAFDNMRLLLTNKSTFIISYITARRSDEFIIKENGDKYEIYRKKEED